VVIKKLHALAPKFYHLELEDEETMLKSKGIQMTWANRQKITSKTLGKQLLELYYPRTAEDGTKLPFQGYMHMSNMLMGVNSANPKFEYGTMLTRHTLPKRLAPVISKRQLVYYTQEANVEYNENTALEALGRIDTIPKGYYLNVDEINK
jgi:hypothetical protein